GQREVLGDDPLAAQQERGGAVASLRLVATAGQAGADVGEDDQRGRAVVESGLGRADPGLHRPDHVVGAHAGVEPERGVDGGGVGLVEVRGFGGGEQQRLGLHTRGRRGQAGPRRLHAHAGGVLVVGRHRTGAPTRGRAQGGGDGLTIEAPIGDVRAVGDDAGHRLAGYGLVRFGIHLPQYGRAAGPDAITRAARQAEDLGFDDVWVSDHLAVPTGQAYPPAFLYEPMIMLTWAAAATTRVGLGTSVLILPYRHPLHLAKE